MLPDNKSVSELMTLSPSLLLAWVEQHSTKVECIQDWQDLAYGVGSRSDIDSDLTAQEYEALVTAAVLLYERLGATCQSPSDRSAAIAEAMAFRAVLISKSGPQPGDSVRDPAILEDWFFRRLNMSLDEAVFLSQNSLTLSSEDFLRISSLKDRVRLMKGVRHQEAFRRRDELSRWYALLDEATHESPTA